MEIKEKLAEDIKKAFGEDEAGAKEVIEKFRSKRGKIKFYDENGNFMLTKEELIEKANKLTPAKKLYMDGRAESEKRMKEKKERLFKDVINNIHKFSYDELLRIIENASDILESKKGEKIAELEAEINAEKEATKKKEEKLNNLKGE